jgi:hypothetical protein
LLVLVGLGCCEADGMLLLWWRSGQLFEDFEDRNEVLLVLGELAVGLLFELRDSLLDPPRPSLRCPICASKPQTLLRIVGT